METEDEDYESDEFTVTDQEEEEEWPAPSTPPSTAVNPGTVSSNYPNSTEDEAEKFKPQVKFSSNNNTGESSAKPLAEDGKQPKAVRIKTKDDGGKGSSKPDEPAPIETPEPPPAPIEETVPDADDAMFGFHLGPVEPVPSIHTSRLILTSVDEAREIAEYVLDQIEFDVNRYFGRYHPQKKYILERPGSNISIISNADLERYYANEPSTMDLYYEKGELACCRDEPLPELPEHLGVDEECQVHLQRNRKKFGRGPKLKYVERGAQTKDMTFLSTHDGERMFRHIYPLREDYHRPVLTARKKVMNVNIKLAEAEDENVDKAKVGAKVKWSKKPRLLPSLPQDYYKSESFWTGSTFKGKYFERQFENGFFNYPLGTTYESEFLQGRMHSKKYTGVVKFPRGDTFEGQWRRGRHLAGRITFSDDLAFSSHKWDYIGPKDRRFYIEHDVGIKPTGQTLFNDRLPPPILYPGWYDTGDGMYHPIDRLVFSYDGGTVFRRTDEKEHKWIMKHCRKQQLINERYTPSFHVDRLPGSSSEKRIG